MLPAEEDIKCTFKANTCYLVVPLGAKDATKGKASGSNVFGRCVENIRNCDVFIDDYDFYIYADVKLYRFQSKRCFDIKELKTLIIQYDSKECCFKLKLRCLPPEAAHPPKPKTLVKYIQIAQYARAPHLEPVQKMDLWKLKRITDICQLQLDNSETLVKFESNYSYGFARRCNGKLQEEDYDNLTLRVPEPHRVSPLQRTIDRILEEMKRFSRDIYKLNFVELQVPAGHDNPIKYKAKLNDTTLTTQQTQLLHNLTCKPEHKTLPDNFVQTEVDCGLISILLAICYDVRCTGNEPTCETGWTRSILSATLCYFEPFDNYKAVVISFMRRALTYPLFRNYELARICVQDAIDVLNSGSSAWLLKQLLITHEYFTESDPSRDVFNVYYIEDYIRYVSNPAHCTNEHFTLIARNVKNVMLDISKRHLDLSLTEIESELLKELINEMHLDEDTEDEDDVDDDDEIDEEDDEDEDVDVDDSAGDDSVVGQVNDTTDSNDSSVSVSGYSVGSEVVVTVSEIDYDDDTSSSSETEGNSVIEQCSSETGTK